MLHTPRDAGQYIASLPKREHDAEEWRTAIEALMLVVGHGGDTMLRIGIMRALIVRGQRTEQTRRKNRSEDARIIRVRTVLVFAAR